MVVTRRNAAAPAEPSQALAAMEQSTYVAVPATESARPKRPGRKITSKATATTRTTTSTATTSTTAATITTRRTRSKATESPLKSLDAEPKRNNQKAVAQKASTANTSQNKRKRNTPHSTSASASATPEPENTEPESAQEEDNDDQGIFFTQNLDNVSRTESFQLESPKSSPRSPDSEYRHHLLFDPPFQSATPARSSDELHVLRDENSQLTARVAELERNLALVVGANNALLEDNDALRRHISQLLTGQVKANQQQPSDFDSPGMDVHDEPEPARPEFITGSESALALLHQIEKAAKETCAAVDSESDSDIPTTSQHPSHRITTAEGPRGPLNDTPSRPMSTPSGFFSRSFSALKSKLGFATPPAPSPTPSRAPPPDTITETLSAPPTPIGERKKTRPRKKKVSPMFTLLTKGVERNDMKDAEKWAKHVIPTLKNDAAFDAKRKRLETPVLMKELNNFPSCKPWETGFGDPLGDMDEDEVVPVWAVYLDMLAEQEEPMQKKSKTNHEVSMDVDDTLSLNEMFRSSESAKLHDSQGNSASPYDFHPRRSVEPSPMFASPGPHQPGNNIFSERHGLDSTAELRADDVDTLEKASETRVPSHNPAQGSFGLDYDSDDEDSTMISETSDTDASAAPLWTQPPPPAPVPAHAPLPGGPVTEATSASTAQQPVDEVERQRQKLMKHTPAKPSRLREAFVPSPSLLSDAGNESIFMATPLPATDLFDDMPDAEDLGLDDEDWANVAALQNTAEWKAEAAKVWPDAILTYDSDEEGLSPE